MLAVRWVGHDAMAFRWVVMLAMAVAVAAEDAQHDPLEFHVQLRTREVEVALHRLADAVSERDRAHCRTNETCWSVRSECAKGTVHGLRNWAPDMIRHITTLCKAMEERAGCPVPSPSNGPAIVVSTVLGFVIAALLLTTEFDAWAAAARQGIARTREKLGV